MNTSFQPIIKLTNICNLNCDYCYLKETLHDRYYPDFMPTTILEKVIFKTIDFNFQKGNKEVNVCFHGGEPTLYDISTLKDTLRNVNKHIDKRCIKVNYSLQTNGIELSDSLIEISKEFNINLGVSIDGPLELNSHYRGSENLTARIIKNIESLNKSNISFGVLSVISDIHDKKAKELYDFYLENNIKSIGLLKNFNKNYIVNNEILGGFLIDLFDFFYYGEAELDIREFNNAILNILSEDGCGVCSMSYRKSCGNYFTVATNGDVHFCDDKIEPSEALINIDNNDISDIFIQEKFLEKRRNSQNFLKKCINCDVYSICRGGCYRHDVLGENLFCEAYRVFYRHINNIIKKEISNGNSKRT